MLISDWLTEVSGNSSKAFCELCKIELNTHKNATNKHAQKLKEIATLSHVTVVQLEKAFKPKISELQKVAEIRAAAFVAKHTALMSADHLMLLMPSYFRIQKLLHICQCIVPNAQA